MRQAALSGLRWYICINAVHAVQILGRMGNKRGKGKRNFTIFHSHGLAAGESTHAPANSVEMGENLDDHFGRHWV